MRDGNGWQTGQFFMEKICTQITPSGDFIPKEFIRVLNFAFVSQRPWVSRISLACFTLQANTLLTISLVICTNPTCESFDLYKIFSDAMVSSQC